MALSLPLTLSLKGALKGSPKGSPWDDITPPPADVPLDSFTAVLQGDRSVLLTATGGVGNKTIRRTASSTGEEVIVASFPSGGTQQFTDFEAAAPDVGAGEIATNDFESGTISPFAHWSLAGGTYAIVADPTGGGRGQVLQLDYPAQATSKDVESGAKYAFGSLTLGAGDSLYAYGRLYVVSNGFSGNRKLIRLNMGNASGTAYPGNNYMVVWMSTTLRFEGSTPGQGVIFSNTNFPITFDAWHEFEVEFGLNSAPGVADGVLRLWLDRTLAGEVTGYTPISATGDHALNFTFGDQTQSTRLENGPLDDRRYWDDLVLSTQRVAP